MSRKQKNKKCEEALGKSSHKKKLITNGASSLNKIITKLFWRKRLQLMFLIWPCIIGLSTFLALYPESKLGFTDIYQDVFPLRDVPIFDDSSKNFKILILPLYPDQKCDIIHSNYEHLIIDRLNKISDSLNCNLSIVLDSSNICVNDIMADSLGKFNNANLVLWGNYDRDCNSDSKVRIKYFITELDTSLKSIKKNNDTGFKVVQNLNAIRNGFLLENTESIILFILGYQYYSKNNFADAIEYLEHEKSYDYYTLAEYILLDCFLMIGDVERAKIELEYIKFNDPKFPYYSYLSSINMVQGNYNDVLNNCQKSLKYDTLVRFEYVMTIYKHSKADYFLKNYLRSLEYIDKLISETSVNDNDIDLTLINKFAYLDKCKYLFEMKNYLVGLRTVNEALSIHKNDVELSNWCVIYLRYNDQHKMANELLEDMLKRNNVNYLTTLLYAFPS